MNEHRPTLRLIRHCVGERADRVLVPEGGLFKRFRCIDPTIAGTDYMHGDFMVPTQRGDLPINSFKK